MKGSPKCCKTFVTNVISFATYFSSNPDRRRKLFKKPCGMYEAGCGLAKVVMSWGSCEYLHSVLTVQDVALPDQALFILRFHKFLSLLSEGGYKDYGAFLSPEEKEHLTWLKEFRGIVLESETYDVEDCVDFKTMEYFNNLLEKYFPTTFRFWKM